MRLWLLIAVASFFVPALLGGLLLPEPVLALLSDHARWGGPIWFAILAAASGLLRQRVQTLLEKAEEHDHWRDLKARLRSARRLQRRMDRILLLSLFLAVIAFFSPVLYAIVPGVIGGAVAASPLGSAALVLWLFVALNKWREEIDALNLELAVQIRQKQQRERQIERLVDAARESSGRRRDRNVLSGTIATTPSRKQ